MKISIQKAINKQIKEEIYSSYLYLAMAGYVKNKGLDGFSNWFVVQSKEEMDHAMGFFNFLLDRNGKVDLFAVSKPPSVFGSYQNLFKEVLKHEEFITKKIGELYELAAKEKDYVFKSFVKWYLDEQVEEEATARAYIDKLKIAKDSSALLMIDQELGQRVYTSLSPNVSSQTR